MGSEISMQRTFTNSKTRGDLDTSNLKSLDPLAVAAGIYDYSHMWADYDLDLQPNKAHSEIRFNAKEQNVANWVKFFWDGKSEGFTTNAEFAELARTTTVEIAGEDFIAVNRVEFGDGDCQHTIFFKSLSSKKGAILSHSDFTMVLGLYDDEEGK